MASRKRGRVTVNPFFNFLREVRTRPALEGKSARETSQIGAREWHQMTEDEKEPYRVMAKRYQARPGTKRRSRLLTTVGQPRIIRRQSRRRRVRVGDKEYSPTSARFAAIARARRRRAASLRRSRSARRQRSTTRRSRTRRRSITRVIRRTSTSKRRTRRRSGVRRIQRRMPSTRRRRTTVVRRRTTSKRSVSRARTLRRRVGPSKTSRRVVRRRTTSRRRVGRARATSRRRVGRPRATSRRRVGRPRATSRRRVRQIVQTGSPMFCEPIDCSTCIPAKAMAVD